MITQFAGWSAWTLTRRIFLDAGLAGAASVVGASLGWLEGGASVLADRLNTAEDQASGGGRLLARPGMLKKSGPTRLHRLGLVRERDALLYVPQGVEVGRPAPLVLLLHGAGGDAEYGMNLLRPLADEAGLILLAPASRQYTWDVIVGGFGPDVALIDRALRAVFTRHDVSPQRLAIGGFSDGASYALSLGLTNGDLFSHVMAFSPGFMAPGRRHGGPRLYISHGTDDQILPIARCSRRIVPQVRRAGYELTYREFDGPHTVPSEVSREAVTLLLST